MYKRHFQMHRLGCGGYINKGHVSTYTTPLGKKVQISSVISIDQYFGQSHNLSHGFVDTSPLAYDDAQASAHLSPSAPESNSLTSDVPDSEIHKMCISRYCQTASELQQISKLRPQEIDYQENPESADEADNPIINDSNSSENG